MCVLRRVGRAAVLVFSAAGAAGCVAGIVGAWAVHGKVAARASQVADRIDTGLGRLSTANHNVRGAVDKARTDVTDVGRETADHGSGGDKGRRASRAVQAALRKKVVPNLLDLDGRLDTWADAAVAVSSLLESLEELPAAGRRLPLGPEQLQQRADQVRDLAAALRRLDSVVGDDDPSGSGPEVAAATSQVDVILDRCLAAVDGWQSDLDTARENLANVNANMLGWVRYGAIAVTALCVWMGAGQLSLFASAWRWCRGP